MQLINRFISMQRINGIRIKRSKKKELLICLHMLHLIIDNQDYVFENIDLIKLLLRILFKLFGINQNLDVEQKVCYHVLSCLSYTFY